MEAVQVEVSSGVVVLGGAAAGLEEERKAEAIASRVAGVVTVQNQIERDLDVTGNVAPALTGLVSDIQDLVRALPLVAVAVGVAVFIGLMGNALASLDGLWRRVSRNSFLAELIATFIRFVFILVGLIAGLELLGATALLSTVLGGAGIAGIALGFAVRDTVDNYVSSLMLSLRQPFRANDHVVIEGHEGRVVRLTSRATILMTLDGNHLRIPNSTVFKAIILNYTRNPQRRFQFDLGIDAQDDPLSGMKTGLEAMKSLDFILPEPEPTAVIEALGDSNIQLRFLGWIDQRTTDFHKGRSLALNAAKCALEAAGFGLPEPIYRLRFDDSAPWPTEQRKPAPAKPPQPAQAPSAKDVAPEDHVQQMVDEERAEFKKDDLLDQDKPVE